MENFKQVLFDRTIYARKMLDVHEATKHIGGQAGWDNLLWAKGEYMGLRQLINELGLEDEYFDYKFGKEQ